MNRLFRMLGYRDREYRADAFSVRIDDDFRELVTVVYTRGGTTRKLGGERIGKGWGGIGIHLAPDVEPEEVPRIVNDLETALRAMRYGYVISRTAAVDAVPDSERQAAIAELGEMGYEVAVSADRKQVSLVPKPGLPRVDKKQSQRLALRMQGVLQSVRGLRPRVEVLAISKDFEQDREHHIPR